MEDDYLAINLRRQSIVQSMQHVAEDTSLLVKIFLAVCTICGGLALPMCKMVGNHSPYMISAWRCAMVSILFIPVVYYEVRKYGEGVAKLFSLKNLLMILLSQVYNTMYVLCQLVALQYTFTSHVLLLSGMISIVLLFWKIIKRLPVTTMELGGILVSIMGSFLITRSGGNEGTYTQHGIIVGDLIAFLGSVFGAFNLQVIAPILQFYRDGIYVIQSNFSSCLLSFVAVWLSGDKCEFSFNPEYGVFGFLHPSYCFVLL